MSVATWDFSKLIVTWAGVTVTGFMNDVTLTCDGGEDAVKTVVGSDGRETVFVFMNNRTGNVVLPLMASARANDVLSAAFAAKTIGPLQIKDLNGTKVCQAPAAVISKRPAPTFGKEISAREWTISFADGDITIGGLAAVS